MLALGVLLLALVLAGGGFRCQAPVNSKPAYQLGELVGCGSDWALALRSCEIVTAESNLRWTALEFKPPDPAALESCRAVITARLNEAAVPYLLTTTESGTVIIETPLLSPAETARLKTLLEKRGRLRLVNQRNREIFTARGPLNASARIIGHLPVVAIDFDRQTWDELVGFINWQNEYQNPWIYIDDHSYLPLNREIIDPSARRLILHGFIGIEEARDIALVLKSGPLPAGLSVKTDTARLHSLLGAGESLLVVHWEAYNSYSATRTFTLPPVRLLGPGETEMPRDDKVNFLSSAFHTGGGPVLPGQSTNGHLIWRVKGEGPWRLALTNQKTGQDLQFQLPSP